MEHGYEDTRGSSPWYKMKTRPKHLPLHKQDELRRIWGRIWGQMKNS